MLNTRGEHDGGGGTLERNREGRDGNGSPPVGAASTTKISGVSKTAPYTLVAGDNGKVITVDATGGEVPMALTAAAALGDGWWCVVRNGSANDNMVRLVASQDISCQLAPSGVRSLPIRKGSALLISSNGGNFAVDGDAAPYMTGDIGVIAIADRVAASPGSPTTGARYIATGVFSITNSAGSVVSTAVGDILEADGTGRFIKITPSTNCGWLAYVQTDNGLYQFQGSVWVNLVATTAQAQAGAGNIAFMTALAVRNALPTRAYAEYVAVTTLTALIPYDDTIPQNTEGTLILSAAIALKSVASRVRVRFKAYGVLAIGAQAIIAALHQDAIANALAVDVLQHSLTGSADTIAHPHPLSIEFEHVPGVTNPTYKINVGPSANTMALNSSAVGTRAFGGASRATLVVEELLT